jgi:membrane fusion protein (multidrug efflux system)
VGKDGKVESLSVEVDRAHEQQWVVRKGLEAGERVVVSGLQKIRSGMAVKVADAMQQNVKG